MQPRQAFIVEGVVSEEATKKAAVQYFHSTGHQVRIHFHSATVGDCNDRCVFWPPEPGK